jgi:hypothetical protein
MPISLLHFLRLWLPQKYCDSVLQLGPVFLPHTELEKGSFMMKVLKIYVRVNV